MEKRNTLDERFINLRQVFHDFQTSVRFSTSNSPADIFANQLKSYEFLGQLEEHFLAEKVQYLYQFVHSIFSLIFTMIREGPNQKSDKNETIKKLMTSDLGVQTEESHIEDKKKTPAQALSHPYMRQKKRTGLEIQIFEKDLTEMSFRERRRALQKMRDMIYAEDDQPNDQGNLIKDFKPNIDKISYSKSDESIKSAIDTFKQSDISTHIFLKHFMEQFVEIKDIKNSSDLLNKELIHSMSRAITKYREVKYQGKGKFRLFSHTIEEIVYPIIDEDKYQINIKLTGEERESERENSKDEEHLDVNFMNEITNLPLPKENTNEFSVKDKPKHRRFPSLMARKSDELHPISQTRSQESIGSTSTISSKPGKILINKKKLKGSFTQDDELSINLQRSSLEKNRSSSSQIPLLLQKDTKEVFNKSRKSFRIQNKEQDQKMIDQEKLKDKIGVKSKKLRKRNISNFFDRRENRSSLLQEKGK